MSKQTKPQLNIAGQQPSASPVENSAGQAFTAATGQVERIPFTTKNWQLVGIGAALLFVGYYLLGSEKFIDAQDFSVSLHIAPPVIIAGYIELIFAIMYQEKQ